MVLKQVSVPDIGGAEEVDVIEILVNPGDDIQKEDSLITLESEKASMEIPSPHAGKVKDIALKIGDKVAQGNLILTMEVLETQEQEVPEQKTKASPDKGSQPEERKETPPLSKVSTTETLSASPAVRRLARELDLNLQQITGTGRNGRLTLEDIKAHIKQGRSNTSLNVAPMPTIDFSQYGEIDTVPLNKIKRFTGTNTHRSWVSIPHVTQFDEADITLLEEFRQSNKMRAEKNGFKLTPLTFIMKAVAKCLQVFPTVNASLASEGDQLILKKYIHLGVAVDTPNGLVVPVIRDVDKKGIFQLAEELKNISQKARDKGLMPQEMQGGSFTISSLGGIGGTGFTPIINAPEVAILGVSRSSIRPVYRDKAWEPRLLLPLSLSYDHRVIDGAEAARFTRHLAECLSDIRQLLL